MIGFITLCCALLTSGLVFAQEGRASRATYRSYDDDGDELTEVVAKPAPTVVPILKQIDKHNDDGSYTYGFEAADGSFKIETKEANGEVRGKYGYIDAHGKLHVVEYGANKYGFQPAGEGIDVPPVNFNVEPEEYEDIVPQKKAQTKEQVFQPRPRPQAVQQAIQPRRPEVVQQLQPWEQGLNVAPATPAPIAPRPKPATPHIVYNNSPTPKRPVFFAGAQTSQPAGDYDYQDAVAPRQPAVVQPRPQPPQSPSRSHTLAITAGGARQAAPAEQSFFVPSPQFSQQVSFAQPGVKPQLRYEPVQVQQRPQQQQQQQLFRPEPEPAFRPQQQREEVRSFAPPPPRPAAKAPRVAGGGFLDQLQEQFSLPQGAGTPTHNIAFGFY